MLPQEWVWVNITEVTSKITDGTHNSPVNLPIGDYKYVTAKNIKTSGVVLDNITYVSKEVHDEIYARCNPEKGDILYIKDGATTGIVAINTLEEPFSLLSSVALIKPIKEISNKFLCYFLQSPLCYASVRDSMKGVGITRITLKQIEKWDVPLPPLSEQHRIVAEIERWFSLINIIENNKADLQTVIKQAKNKILDFAIHGKLVPQDPNDEPAIKLMKRINPDFTPCDNGHYPLGWCKTQLKYIADYVNGRAFKPEEWETNGLPIVRIQNLNDETAPYNKSSKSYEEKYLIHKGDLLFAWAASLGTYIWEKGDAWLNQHIFKVIPFVFMDKLYLYYSLESLIKDFYKESHGSGMVHITKKKFEDIECFVPPLAEQQRIVAKIEKLFSILDNIQKSLEA